MQQHQPVSSRRNFLKKTMTLATAPAVIAGWPLAQQQIIHQVFFWLGNPASEADKAALIVGLKTLNTIPQVQNLVIGVPAATAKRTVLESSYQVSAITYFNDIRDHDHYQVHPVHKAFIAQYSHLWARLQVYDIAVKISGK